LICALVNRTVAYVGCVHVCGVHVCVCACASGASTSLLLAMELNNSLVAVRRAMLPGATAMQTQTPPGLDIWLRGLQQAGGHTGSCHWLSSPTLLYPRVLWSVDCALCIFINNTALNIVCFCVGFSVGFGMPPCVSEVRLHPTCLSLTSRLKYLSALRTSPTRCAKTGSPSWWSIATMACRASLESTC
jgi:hypothetical protein